MRTHERRQPEPPQRAPYIRVTLTVLGERTDYVLRVPSLHRVSQLAAAIGDDQKRALFALSATTAGGVSVAVAAEAMRVGGAGLAALVGALIGVSWKDPVTALDTPQPMSWADADIVRAYGAAVFEELHEAGWGLGPLLLCMFALIREITAAAEIDAEVLEQADFFLGRKATPPAGSPRPSPSSSVDGSEPSAGES